MRIIARLLIILPLLTGCSDKPAHEKARDLEVDDASLGSDDYVPYNGLGTIANVVRKAKGLPIQKEKIDSDSIVAWSMYWNQVCTLEQIITKEKVDDRWKLSHYCRSSGPGYPNREFQLSTLVGASWTNSQTYANEPAEKELDEFMKIVNWEKTELKMIASWRDGDQHGHWDVRVK